MNLIENNINKLIGIRTKHKEAVMARFNKKFTTRRDVLDNEELMEPQTCRSMARKLFMKEVDFIKYVVNKEGAFTATKLDEQITKNFIVHKVWKDSEKVLIVLTNENRKVFDRGVYGVVLEKGRLSFNIINTTRGEIRMIDKINVPVVLKPSPLEEKAIKKVARKQRELMKKSV